MFYSKGNHLYESETFKRAGVYRSQFRKEGCQISFPEMECYMTTSRDNLEIGFDEKPPRTLPLFRILILFEDENANHQAKRLHDHLFQNVKDQCRLETCCWDLSHRDGFEELVESITMADIIIVAGRETSEFSNEIQTALKIGLISRRVTRGALVALLGRKNTREQNPSTLHLRLQRMAQETGLSFFPGAFEIPQDNPACDFDSIHARACRMTPTMNRILHRNVSPIDYGINE